MVTFTINIPPMLAYIPAPWILWVMTEFQELYGIISKSIELNIKEVKAIQISICD